jgi:Fe-S-cluster containining protein
VGVRGGAQRNLAEDHPSAWIRFWGKSMSNHEYSDQSPNRITVAGAEARVLSPTDLFEVACGVGGCESNCCTKSAPVVLNPYELSLICRESRMSYEDLLDIVDTDRANNFPLVMLPRDPACHFWTGRGCSIYRGRPLACRLFPLGRVFENRASHIVQPAVNLCTGISSAPSRTVADYLASQDTDLLIRMADAWIEFVNEVERLPLRDAPITSVAFHMLVYSPDTPPSQGPVEARQSLEDRFLLRLSTARKQLPRFLKMF